MNRGPEDVPWTLVSAPGFEIPDGASPTASFAGGRVAGSTGCNRFTTAYTLRGKTVRLGIIATTRMACPPPLDALERAYLDALASVARWHVADEMLSLADADGNELLRFASPGDVR